MFYIKRRYLYFICFGFFVLLFSIAFWYVSQPRKNGVVKNINVIYSLDDKSFGYRNFQQLLEKDFQQEGIQPHLNVFFLNCEMYNEKEEIVRMRQYLDTLNSSSVDLFLVVGDQASYSFLKTEHPLLVKKPVVLCNVLFPNENVLRKYENNSVYTLRDTPDFAKNIEFIKKLHDNEYMHIFYNLDVTYLGKQSYALLKSTVDPKSFRCWIREWSIYQESFYVAIKEIFQSDELVEFQREELIDEFTVNLFPLRYMTGISLLRVASWPNNQQYNHVFLLDKLDLASSSIPHILNIPTFSCLRAGFNENAKIVGGYMATDELSVEAVVKLSKQLFTGQSVAIPKIQDLEKEYVIDWNYFSSYETYSVKRVPKNVRIINFPFYDRYRGELFLLGLIFVMLFVIICSNLIKVRRQSKLEQKNMAALKKVQEHLSLSINGGHISLWNIRDNELEFDNNFKALTGMSDLYYNLNCFLTYLHPDDLKEIRQLLDNITALQKMVIKRIRLRFDENGAYKWFEIRFNGLRDNSGQVIIAGIIQDIQELVDREQELIRAKELAEKAELKQSFLANMSHEIRTPLNAIVGFTNILFSDDGADLSPEEKQEILVIVNRNNDLLLKLIGDVLEISRLDSGYQEFRIEEYDLIKIVKELYRTHQVIIHTPLKFNLEITCDSSVRVNIDKLRFTQVISNFLSNANKFTQEGYITLGCEVNREKNEVNIYVEDSGKGIDQNQLNMIFERFYKTDEFAQGTGLGLSICKVIMHKLSGRIEVQSRVGKGSRFTAILPLQ